MDEQLGQIIILLQSIDGKLTDLVAEVSGIAMMTTDGDRIQSLLANIDASLVTIKQK